MIAKVEPLKKHIGAVIHVGRENLCDDDTVQRCLGAMEDHGVVVFPRLNATDEEQMAFTERLGPRVVFTQNKPGGNVGDPNIYKLTLDPAINDRPEYVLGSYFWHMDGMTSDLPVPAASLLRAVRVAKKGGQTEFANTQAGYETLRDEMKAEIADFRVVHDARTGLIKALGTFTDDQHAEITRNSVIKEQPLVWKHKSGRKSLILSTSGDRIADRPLAEGRALLQRLLEWCVQPDFSYSHDWQEGDLVVWNNTTMLHRVVPFSAESGRLMHRTSVGGESAN
jgi:alpha-ketoglutarate-dependent taurine dioxygenase